MLALVLAAAIGLISTISARAQTPPSAAEYAAYTGLHRAAASGDVAAIRALLAQGAAVDGRDGAGRTPLHVAAFGSHHEALSALAAGGGDLNALESGRYDVVTIAAVRDDVRMVRLALTLGGNAKLITSRYDGTALIAAAHLGHDGVVQALVEAGAPLDHVNNLGWTALIEAVVLGNGGPRYLATVKVLVAAGASRTIGDRNGVSPLQHAEQRGYADIAAVLRGAPR